MYTFEEIKILKENTPLTDTRTLLRIREMETELFQVFQAHKTYAEYSLLDIQSTRNPISVIERAHPNILSSIFDRITPAYMLFKKSLIWDLLQSHNGLWKSIPRHPSQIELKGFLAGIPLFEAPLGLELLPNDPHTIHGIVVGRDKNNEPLCYGIMVHR